jgi:hypothetical protein
MDDFRKWHLAFAQLDAFANNLPPSVSEKNVAEYHAILDLIHDATSEDVSAFRIPLDDVKPRVIEVRRRSYSGRGGGAVYGTDKYCDRNLMVRKLESVRGYFARISPPQEPPKPGFV